MTEMTTKTKEILEGILQFFEGAKECQERGVNDISQLLWRKVYDKWFLFLVDNKNGHPLQRLSTSSFCLGEDIIMKPLEKLVSYDAEDVRRAVLKLHLSECAKKLACKKVRSESKTNEISIEVCY